MSEEEVIIQLTGMKDEAECYGYKSDSEVLDYAINHIKADRWISVTEEDLPKENGFYLVTRLDRRGERIVDMAYYLKSAKEFECHNVSHWKPLPEPYKESEATNED